MKIYKNPSKDRWAEIIARPRLDLTKLNDTVATGLADVKARGDEAVMAMHRKALADFPEALRLYKMMSDDIVRMKKDSEQ